MKPDATSPELFADLGKLLRQFIQQEIRAAVADELPRQFAAAVETLRASMAPTAEEYVTRREAARMTSYSRRQIDRLIARGELKAAGPNRDRIERVELRRFMEGPGWAGG